MIPHDIHYTEVQNTGWASLQYHNRLAELVNHTVGLVCVICGLMDVLRLRISSLIFDCSYLLFIKISVSTTKLNRHSVTRCRKPWNV